jgi:CBS domain-containing protein
MLDRIGTNQIELPPVVSGADVHKLEGIVTLRDVLAAYGVTGPDRALGLPAGLRSCS